MAISSKGKQITDRIMVMQPNTPQQNDPYDFIMQSPQGGPKPSLNPSSMKMRIIVVAIGAILLIIIGIVVASLLGSAGNAQKQRYIEIAQKQTEIVRISTLADKKAKNLSTRSFAATTQLAISTDQRKFTAALATRGVKEKDQNKLLPLGKNDKTDSALDEAEKNGRYDETFRQILEGEIASYQKLLNGAASGASNAERPILETAFKNSNTLLAKPDKTPRPQPAGSENLDSEATIGDGLSEDDDSDGFEEDSGL